jgi:uncharacterized protein (TIGR01244 family)
MDEPTEAEAMRIHLRMITIAVCSAAALATAAAAAKPDTYGIPNATFPEPGVMAAGQPTGEQIQLAAEDGYRTLFDLRQPEEPRDFDEVLAARQNGLAYVNIPVTLATLGHATIDRFLEAMERAERPVLLHCGTSERVGALYYAWLVLEKGETPEKALQRAKAAGLHQPELIHKVTKLVAERRPSPSHPPM